MERQDIEVFLTLAEELHFARTAERLRLAPASISQTIKKLERRLGAPLFTRTTRRVDLTPLGRQLRDDLSPAYAQVQAAIERAVTAGRGETGELCLGYMSAAVARRVLTLIDAVRGHAPGIQVNILETALADLYGPLRRAEVDLSVLPLPVVEPDLTVGPVLLSETALLAVSATHPLARRAQVTADDLAEQTFLFAQNLPEYWVDHHLPIPRSAAKITTLPGFQEILAYAASGHGVALVGTQVEQLYPRPNLTCLPIEGGPTVDYALVWRTADLSPPATAFLRHAQTHRT
ncbi:LysR family transcriptional regulator [Actinokineospora sp. UTMC 2448]|uniref:LysR family transcriptional regulator n=1 Tax=Actinokineospora sp. UTMC 2448 TaxID=2268449 RepID=UPI002164AE5D|nr:LysR family transcriptional regulator [Actinokineospora sp. UTMC 2448]UVS78452.1 Morphology and auto-aggregation control protein [Actinokineospora sp. UTMC 2448]